MILSDMIVDAASPAGWVLIPEPTAKERRYCASKNLEIIECGIPELLEAAGQFNAKVKQGAATVSA